MTKNSARSERRKHKGKARASHEDRSERSHHRRIDNQRTRTRNRQRLGARSTTELLSTRTSESSDGGGKGNDKDNDNGGAHDDAQASEIGASASAMQVDDTHTHAALSTSSAPSLIAAATLTANEDTARAALITATYAAYDKRSHATTALPFTSEEAAVVDEVKADALRKWMVRNQLPIRYGQLGPYTGLVPHAATKTQSLKLKLKELQPIARAFILSAGAAETKRQLPMPSQRTIKRWQKKRDVAEQARRAGKHPLGHPEHGSNLEGFMFTWTVSPLADLAGTRSTIATHSRGTLFRRS